MERSQTPVEMNVRRRVWQALPSDSSQFVDESGSGDIFSVAVVHQRQDGSRFIVTGLVPGYDHIGYVQDISGMNQGIRSTEDSYTFRDRGIVFDASSNMSHGIISMFN